MSNEIMNFTAKFAIGSLTIYAYDMVTGLDNSKSMNDALIFGFSSGIGELLVNNFFTPKAILGLSSNPQTNSMINSYLIKPVLATLLYSYLYDSWYRDKYNGNAYNLRSKNTNYIVSYVSNIIADMTANPIWNMLGWKSY